MACCSTAPSHFLAQWLFAISEVPLCAPRVILYVYRWWHGWTRYKYDPVCPVRCFNSSESNISLICYPGKIILAWWSTGVLMGSCTYEMYKNASIHSLHFMSLHFINDFTLIRPATVWKYRCFMITLLYRLWCRKFGTYHVMIAERVLNVTRAFIERGFLVKSNLAYSPYSGSPVPSPSLIKTYHTEIKNVIRI